MSVNNINLKRDNSPNIKFRKYNDENTTRQNYHNTINEASSRYSGYNSSSEKDRKKNFSNTFSGKSRGNSNRSNSKNSTDKNNKNLDGNKNVNFGWKNENNSNVNNNKVNNRENDDGSYKDLLEQKIRFQAERLCELQNYKALCEKRISQINPSEVFPLNEKTVQHYENLQENKISFGNFPMSNNSIGESNNLRESYNNILNENNQLKLIISNLEKEKENLRKIYSKADRPLADIENEIITLERIPNENLREAYLNLQEFSLKLKEEKEAILKSLNQEVLLNEEQRNYIEMLKSLLENSIINKGLAELLQQQKNTTCPKHKTMIEYICDISSLQSELESRLKENVEQNAIISRQDKEILFLKQVNIENDLKREKIVESLQIGLSDLEQTRVLVQNLETEKKNLKIELEELRDQNNLLEEENSKLLSEEKNNKKSIGDLEEDNRNKANTIDDLNKLVDQQTLLENKLIEYKDKFIHQNQEFEKILFYKENLEKKLASVEKKSQISENTNNEKELLIKNLEEKLSENKILFEEECSKHIKTKAYLEEKEFEFKKEINSLRVIIDENRKNADKINFEFIELNKKYESDKKQFELLYNDLNKKFEAEKKQTDLLISENIKLKNEFTNLNQEILKLKEKNNDLLKFKQENSTLISEISHLQLKIKELNRNEEIGYNEFNNLNEDYNLLKQKYDELIFEYEEITSLQKEYEKDIEIAKTDKNKSLNLYEKEKKENINKDNLIKKLENEIIQKSTFANNINKISNLSFVNLKMAFKNSQNALDNYFIKFSTLKNKINLCNSENKDQVDIISSDFNFRRYVGKDGHERKLSERVDLRRLNKKRIDKDLFTNNSSPHNETEKSIKEIILSIESFGEWINIIKEEIKSTIKIISDYEIFLRENNIYSNNNEIEEPQYQNKHEKIIKIQDINKIKDNYEIRSTESYIFNDEFEKLKILNSEYKLENSKILKELKSFRNDNKKLYDHNKNISYNFNCKINLLEKEKKFFHNLLIKITSLNEMKIIRVLIDQILDIYNSITDLENEKLKIEKKLEKNEIDLKSFIEKDNNNLENSDIYKDLNGKLAKTKNYLGEVNRNLQEKKQILLSLENKLNKDKETSKNLVQNEENYEKEKGNNKNYDKPERLDRLKIENLKRLKIFKSNFDEKIKNFEKNSNQVNDSLGKKENEKEINGKTENFQFEERYTNNNINHEDFNSNDDQNNYEFDKDNPPHCNQYANIANNTENEFYNKNKATNVFKKNYLDGNKSDLKIDQKNEKKINFDLDKLNFNYKINHDENLDINKIESDKSKRVKDDAQKDLIDKKESIENENFNDCSDSDELNNNNLYTNFMIKNRKSSNVTIDTNKINEKYDKILSNFVDMKNKEKANNDGLNKFEDCENLQDKNIDCFINENKNQNVDNIFEKNIHKKIPCNNNIKKSPNLNFDYQLNGNENSKKSQINQSENIDIKDEKILYNFDYKREKKDRKESRNFKNNVDFLTDLGKFQTSPEKMSIKNNENYTHLGLVYSNESNRENYSMHNNFTFNNQDTENSNENRISDKKLKLNTEADIQRNNEFEINPIKNIKKFNRKKFDIDI